ncbi:MAG: hypothetical protein CVU23_01250 [Betaproteobacteria bacterium HGW-Betaproteobacteria-17]|jgi:hypothetical protein|nr:MAG: hypothetical protein CVU56_10650 [Deltaproteobacteria bacterium HGW-Deltaproteobacteria-14]PKO73716.1 MAG: hypothetical protein CVU23_01250 [Betaproteobacteria bacterium HGW-Betaproteobacteria-17]
MRALATLNGRLVATLLIFATTALGGCDLEIPIGFNHAFDVPIALGDATGAAAGQTAPADVSYPVAMNAVTVDLVSSSTQLASNRDKVQSISLTGVTVTPRANTLTGATPPIDLYIGPAGATSPTQAVKIATLPAIPAGSTAVVTASIDATGQQNAQPWLTSLDFTVIPVATLTVKAGQTVPGGAADLHIVLGVEATVDALK